MARVAPIKMMTGSRALWFDPGDLEIHKGDPVVVLTARGVEFGEAADELMDVSDEEIAKLKSPLKPVKRLATEEDIEKAREMERLSAGALPLFKQMAVESGVEMRPISVEYLLDGDKAIFYFEADDRVDFRDLVRKLAAHFHVRVDMRQIGVRDEARMVGGLGHCGQELCCKRLGGEFCPVSIRMAKEQDLSLNPQKISGVCGRLMCCLRYEYDAYKDFKSRAPKANATVQTPEGPAKVVDLDVPREVVSLKVADGKPVKVPLSDFEPAEEGARPNCVGEDAWARATAETNLTFMGESSFLTSQFTGSDKLADAGSIRRTGSAQKGQKAQKSQKAQKPEKADKKEAASDRKPRRRRSTKVGESASAEATATAAATTKGKQKQAGGQKQEAAEKAAPKRRPRSRGNRGGSQQAQGQMQGQSASQQAQGQAQGQGASQQPSRQASRQERRANAQAAKSANAQAAKSSGKGGEASARRHDRPANQNREATAQPQAKQGPRPGQKSSGLRNRPQAQGDQSAASGSGEHRRARRRSHKAGGSNEQN